jgi:ferredoxin
MSREPPPSCSVPARDDEKIYSVWLDPGAKPYRARAHQSLLASALEAGIELTSSCRNGTCRACIRQLARGHVRYRIAWPGLSAEEKAQGFILPCVAHPDSDLVFQPIS